MLNLLDLLHFLLFLGSLGLFFMKIKGLTVKLIDFEIMKLCNKAISGDLEKFVGLLLVFLQILAEVAEQVRTLLDKARHFAGNIIYYGKTIHLMPY